MKFKQSSILLSIYILVATTHLFAIVIKQPMMADITKFLLMPILLVHVLLNTKKQLVGFIAFTGALVFCWAGDVLLMFTEHNEMFFLLGLAAFLVGHLLYIVTFAKMSDKNVISKSLQPLFYLIPIIFAISLLIVLFPNLGEMRVPVIAYAMVISCMSMAAMRRWQKTESTGFGLVLTGAALFIISDALIAINKFHTAFSGASFFIMITYIAAQYLIVTGLLKHVHPVKY